MARRARRCSLGALNHFRQAKIDQKDMTFRCDLDVARLEIPMKDGRLARVQISQRIAHRRADDDRIVFADCAQAFHALA